MSFAPPPPVAADAATGEPAGRLHSGRAPIARAQRITSLDTVRGFATLGILIMNAVSFGLADAAYANLDADGSDTWLDWTIGVLARVFIDQKMMALFSLLFGVGVVIFADRAAAKGHRAVGLSLWRNLLLLAIGIAHTFLWEGDVLVLYAVCAPIVLLMRKLDARLLLGVGTAFALIGVPLSALLQSSLSAGAPELGEAWYLSGGSSDSFDLVFIAGAVGRALGLMLIGVGLYRLGLVQGRHSATNQRLIRWGFGVGLPLSILGPVINIATDWSGDWALYGHIPTTLGTVPMALGFLGLIIRWNNGPETSFHPRIRAVGQMALTNYLTQSVLGIVILNWALHDVDLSRTAVAAFVIAVWTLQLLWSQAWLSRFRFGPVEWLWRTATYRSVQPRRRSRNTARRGGRLV